MLRILCIVLLLVSACRPEAEPTAPQAKPTAPQAKPTAPEERSTTALAASPTALSSSFQVTVSGQTITADNLPPPDQYYAQLMTKHGRDLSPCSATPTAQPGSCPRPPSLETDLKQHINVELILDASGSMAETIGSETKLQVAQRVLSDFVGTLPANANVSLRVYGHKGSNADADKAESCGSSELVYPFARLDASKFQSAIKSFQPTGWTPLGLSLDRAASDFQQFDPATSSNFVYVVTDGVETCDGDPVASARALHGSNVEPVVNIVGFDLDPSASDELRDAAQAGGGKFYIARDASELSDVFKSKFDWVAWTQYYNCRFAAANTQADTALSAQNASFNCVQKLVNDEYREMLDDANDRLKRVNQAVDAEVRRRNTPEAAAGAQAIETRLQENWGYVSAHEQARWEAVTNAQQSQWATVTQQTVDDYRRVTSQLSDEYRQSMQP